MRLKPAALVVLLCACALLAAGAPPRPRPLGPLVTVEAHDLPPLEDDLDAASLRAAVEVTLPAYARRKDAGASAAARRLLETVDAVPDPSARRAAIASAFRVVRLPQPILLTAYYEPVLDARLAPDPTFRYPLYARPPELVDVEPAVLDGACECRGLAGRVESGRLRPYPTRAEIEAGALAGRGLELAWAADPIELFVLHVQGSGRLRLQDGREVGVRYAGTNGRPYRGLARTLRERGLVSADRTALPDLRRALEALPAEQQMELLVTNERYTFFRRADRAPVGRLAVVLTPGRSIATDPRLVPPGALAYLATPSVHRFVVSQDAGAAIVGARADLFLGAGAAAELQAGRMREHGDLYLLLPR